jgi:hypothetical protein
MDSDVKKMLEEILAAVKGLAHRVSRLESVAVPAVGDSSPARAASKKKLSIKEFIISRAPSNGVQMTLAIAYYLENHEGISPFNAADIEKGFRSARETVPTNINDTVNQCVRKGHFMEEKEKKDSKKTWVVTRSGEEAVTRGFGETQS